MNYIEEKYINLISNRFERFKKIGQRYNFRCPICNDSQKSKIKARGWIYTDRTTFDPTYHCHNCGFHKPFKNFLYEIDQRIYFEYIQELMFDNGIRPKKEEIDPSKFISKNSMIRVKNPLNDIINIRTLSDDHYAKKYIINRMIPEKEWDNIYYAPKFKEWTNSVIPDKFESLKRDESRLILPLLDEKGNMYGYQGRSFRKDNDLKYITIMIDDSKKKIFGLNRIDNSKPKRAVEGPIDSFFIDNCLSSCGGDIQSYFNKDVTIIYDNERSSRHTIKKIEKTIDLGYSVVIWPDRIKEKDANLMYKAGVNIEETIKLNTFSGLEASMKLNNWRRDK